MPIKVLNNKGEGYTDTIIAGIQYAINHHANIINLSLGYDVDSKAMHEVIQQAVSHNILVVAAAGNDGNNWIKGESEEIPPDGTPDTNRTTTITAFPANYEEVISVGAVEQLNNGSLTVADFSNAMKIDVAAPGVNIYSTHLDGVNPYMSGTSQAAPFVAGFAALIKANNAKLDVAHIRAIIENSATSPNLQPLSYTNVNRQGDNKLYSYDLLGHGIINGQKAFQQARLDMIPDKNQLDAGGTVTFNVYVEDIHGDVIPDNSDVTLSGNSILKTLISGMRSRL